MKDHPSDAVPRVDDTLPGVIDMEQKPNEPGVVEIGGKVLGPMVKRILPDAKVTSVISIEDIEALAKEIA